MNPNELYAEAMQAKALYNVGAISEKESKKRVAEYAQYFNELSRATAKKYGVKPKLFSFASFMR